MQTLSTSLGFFTLLQS